MQRGRNGGTDAEPAFLRPKSVVLHVFMRTKLHELSCYSRASAVVSIMCYTVGSDAVEQIRIECFNTYCLKDITYGVYRRLLCPNGNKIHSHSLLL